MTHIVGLTTRQLALISHALVWYRSMKGTPQTLIDDVEKAQEKLLAPLTFADCVQHFSKEFEGHKAIAIAEDQPFVRDGECEIDSFPIVSEGADNGAYVMAWVWAPYPDSEWDNEPDDGHQHDYTEEPDDDMGVPGALMCQHCGALSTDE